MAIFGTKKDTEKQDPKGDSKGEKKSQKKEVASKRKDAKQADVVKPSVWAVRRNVSNPEDVLKKMRITEKSAILAGEHHAYTFLIDPRYGKKDVVRAFEKVYDKTPIKVNITKLPGKKKRTRMGVGRTSGKVKAIVYLSQKEKIDFV